MKSWIFFEKKVKSKKNDKVFSVSCQGEHKPRKRWKDSRFGHEFIIAGIAIGGRAPCPPPHATPMLFIHKFYEQNFDQYVQ